MVYSANPSLSIDQAAEVYRARLTTIIEGFLELGPEDTTSLWRSLLRKKSVLEWVDVIDSCTSERFKDLLSGELPPAPDQSRNLEYNETNRPGVYLSMIYRKDKTGHRYVYIGSASSPYGGLNYRVSQHKNSAYSLKAA